jgi:hypothetical protein
VVTGAAERQAERIAHLVYLDATLPMFGAEAAPVVVGDDWLVDPVPRPMPDKAEEAWMAERRRPMPRRCLAETLPMTKPIEDYDFSLTYIKAMLPAAPSTGPQGFWVFAGRVKNNPRWRYREVDCDHMVPQKKPRELAELLLEVLE